MPRDEVNVKVFNDLASTLPGVRQHIEAFRGERFHKGACKAVHGLEDAFGHFGRRIQDTGAVTPRNDQQVPR